MDLVLASGNAGKLAELELLLAPLAVTLTSQGKLGIEAPPEPHGTFVENALVKARHASAHSGRAAIADDSGLAIEALGGAPGVHSARYAGAGATDADNNRKLIAALADHEQRSAAFHSVLVFITHPEDPCPTIACGRWAGEIVADAAGDGGFGYDPHFYVPSERCTAAQLDPARKNLLSHRGKAAAALLQALSERFPELVT
ncbi:MAG: RdgB/HAM1 family non-canonical purine NTP pyrophosphatase [Pseudomonadota bacterium]